jgi:vacuolar-type H+-ATPase subunit H
MAETAQEAESTEKEPEVSSAEAMLEMILMKEDEIKVRIQRAENEAQRLVEEAKLDAAHKKRKAVAEDIGQDLREKELSKARLEAEEINRDVQAQVDEIKKKGTDHFEDAAKVVIGGVLPELK